jgi:hypothetical protein
MKYRIKLSSEFESARKFVLDNLKNDSYNVTVVDSPVEKNEIELLVDEKFIKALAGMTYKIKTSNGVVMDLQKMTTWKERRPYNTSVIDFDNLLLEDKDKILNKKIATCVATSRWLEAFDGYFHKVSHTGYRRTNEKIGFLGERIEKQSLRGLGIDTYDLIPTEKIPNYKNCNKLDLQEALGCTIEQKELKLIKQLLRLGADPHKEFPIESLFSGTPLSQASEEFKPEVEKLIKLEEKIKLIKNNFKDIDL